jgi:type IV pilus assembly protein PilN
MLRINLATRPFYNVRAVRAVLGIATAAVLALVLYDVAQLVNLTFTQRSLGARASDAEAQATRIRAEAERTRRQIDPEELQIVANAAREANAIIDRRAFSWTALFERFEATLPSDVRITAVQPTLNQEGITRLRIAVQARRAEDLDAFVEAMEDSRAFREALAIQDVTNDDGTIDATIETTYVDQAGPGDSASDASQQAPPPGGQL